MSLRLLDCAAPVLRAAREGGELSQVQIAERAGVSHATISRLGPERRGPEPDPDELVGGIERGAPP